MPAMQGCELCRRDATDGAVRSHLVCSRAASDRFLVDLGAVTQTTARSSTRHGTWLHLCTNGGGHERYRTDQAGHCHDALLRQRDRIRTVDFGSVNAVV